MNKIVRMTLATGFTLAVCFSASSSFATDTREAIRACSANPKCQFDVGEDGVVISIDGVLIVCPIKNGPCGVTPARTGGHQVPDGDLVTDSDLQVEPSHIGGHRVPDSDLQFEQAIHR